MIITVRTSVTAAAASVLLASAVLFAQQPPPPNQADSADTQAPPNEIHPIQPDRAYRSKRDRTLSRHERFGFSDIPPGYTRAQWNRTPAVTESYDRGYEDGFEQGWRAARRAAANQRSDSLHAAALTQGLEHFHNRRYGAAARNFILAARKDQGDPLSRLHAAHAMTALQHYDDAYHLIRRAFQLQPELAYVAMDIRRDYSDQTEFQKHLEQLEKRAKAAKDNARVWTVLGYYRLFSDRPAAAYRALRHACQLDRDDKFAARLLNAARISIPAAVDAETEAGSR
ncbi:MAG: hypothetical protein V3W34_04690 [Phycisphaerae bacterium]